MVELELTPDITKSRHARHRSRAQIDCVDLGFDDLHVTKNASERIDNIARMQISSGHFVQHRGEQDEILAADEHHVCFASAREAFVEVHCGVNAREASTGDHDLRLHVFVLSDQPVGGEILALSRRAL